jgi:putative zinc finger/helix-turn-helix YgiT family protein
MPIRNASEKVIMKVKPFPWMCPHCREKTVVSVQKDYSLSVEHDGKSYEVTVAGARVPTCTRCGEAVVTSDLAERVTAELCRLADLLPVATIRQQRQMLGLTQSQLAAALRIPEATLARWESGMQLPPRALDLLLRLYFDSAEVRQACTPPSPATSGPTALSPSGE